MKKETLKKRLETLKKEKHVSPGSTAFRTMMAISNGERDPKGKIRTCHTNGSGRYTHNYDMTPDFRRLLDALKIKYVEGNDAARGGLTGNYIRITTKID